MRSVLTVLALGLAMWSAEAPAVAQKSKEKADPNIRSVQGTVLDASDAPVAGAVVYLKNTKTLQIRTFNSKEDGGYIFHGLSTNIDFELKAEHGGASSDWRTLSVFDSRHKAIVNLKLKK